MTLETDLFGGVNIKTAIIDLGSYRMKFGLSGEFYPEIVKPTVYSSNPSSVTKKNEYCFNSLYYQPEDEIHPLITNKEIGSMDAFKTLFNTSFSSIYPHPDKGSQEVYPPCIVSESHLATSSRAQISEFLFEEKRLPALYFAKDAALSAYSVGKTTATVIDIGHDLCTVSPVIEGFQLFSSSHSNNIAGRYLNYQLLEALQTKYSKSHSKLSPSETTRSFEQEFVPLRFLPSDKVSEVERRNSKALNIKETKKEKGKAAKDSHKPKKQKLGKADSSSDSSESSSKTGSLKIPISKSFFEWSSQEFASKIFKDKFFTLRKEEVNEASENESEGKNGAAKIYEMPSGEEVRIEQEKGNAILEGLFEHMQISDSVRYDGIHMMYLAAISASDVEVRKELYSNGVLLGGGSNFIGIHDRIREEVDRATEDMSAQLKVRINCPDTEEERSYGPWIGGNILASLGTFQSLWVARQEYEEAGFTVFERRCY